MAHLPIDDSLTVVDNASNPFGTNMAKNEQQSPGREKKKAAPRTKKRTVAIKKDTLAASLHQKTTQAKQDSKFPVVGIGSSAGGLEALVDFFSHLPAACDIAFVVIMHLDPHHTSILPELLQRETDIKVFSITDGMTLQNNSIYVAPPNKDVAIIENTFQLMSPVKTGGIRLPIDFFFQSLAAERRHKAASIILSGTGNDGTLGIGTIKAEGGLVMVQEEASAKYSGMPRSAINTGLADIVLPPGRMPEKLVQYFQHPIHLDAEDHPIDSHDDVLRKIWVLLRARTGYDFSSYKKSALLRRIERRMNIQHLQDVSQYIRFLRENSVELDKLFHDFLIGVTSFFRDAEAFELLRNKILPERLANFPADQAFRAWIPGCSTGEEAYSVAIIFRETLAALRRDIPLQIFGTDLDPMAIDKARDGLFPNSIAKDISPQRLQRFFIKEDAWYQVRKELRETIVFSQQNILQDPPFSKIDMLCCRNLLIYLSTEAQKRLLPLFHFSLKPKGLLFMGTSETVGTFSDLFAPVSKKWKIYQKRDIAVSEGPRVYFPTTITDKPFTISPAPATDVMKQSPNFAELTHKTLMENFSPPCAIINSKGDIFYIYGRTGKLLEPATGQPRMNILDMARKGLRLELGAAIRKAFATNKKVTHPGVLVQTNGDEYCINLRVLPVADSRLRESFMMVVFEEATASAVASPTKRKHSRQHQEQEEHVKALEKEMELLRENHQTTVEELETANEELRSINEEMQSANEELQSTNEELEASREEHLSMNEELMTVNAELQNKNDELSRIHSDMKNLLNSTDIATIFVDNDLKIKHFTPQATKIANLIATDIGRPLEHIATKIIYPELFADIREVNKSLGSVRKEIKTKGNEWFQVRILPYRTLDNQIDGAVLTFSSIDMQKKTQQNLAALNEKLTHARDYVENIIDTVREALLVLDSEMHVVLANRSFYRMFQVQPEETLNKKLFTLGDQQWNIPALRELLQKITTKDAIFEDYVVTHTFPHIGARTMVLNGRRIMGLAEVEHQILLAIEDTTGNQQGEEEKA